MLGQTGGTEAVTLTTTQVPAHKHVVVATTSIGNETGPAGNLLAQSSVASAYVGDVIDSRSRSELDAAGRRQPAAREHGSPFLTVSFIISLFGIFPTQN